MSHKCRELIEVLTRLARRRLALEAQRDANFERGLDAENSALYPESRRFDSALNALIRWIHDRTGINRDDLREVAHRVGTAAGLVAWDCPEEDGTTTKYRDLRWILPKLHDLDCAPTTPASLTEVLRDYPAALAETTWDVAATGGEANGGEGEGQGQKRAGTTGKQCTGDNGKDTLDDPIPIAWLRSVVRQKVVKGASDKLKAWCCRRNVKLVKIANRWCGERGDLLTAFSQHPRIKEHLQKYGGDDDDGD